MKAEQKQCKMYNILISLAVVIHKSKHNAAGNSK